MHAGACRGLVLGCDNRQFPSAVSKKWRGSQPRVLQANKFRSDCRISRVLATKHGAGLPGCPVPHVDPSAHAVRASPGLSGDRRKESSQTKLISRQLAPCCRRQLPRVPRGEHICGRSKRLNGIDFASRFPPRHLEAKNIRNQRPEYQKWMCIVRFCDFDVD